MAGVELFADGGRIGGSLDGSLADARLGLFTVCRLEAGTVFTFSDIDLSVGVLTTVDRTLDDNVGGTIVLGGGVVSAVVVREFDLEVGGGLFVGFGSSHKLQINFFVAVLSARTVSILGDVDLLLNLIGAYSWGREAGREGRVVFLPSDAVLSWKLDFALDVSLGGCLFGVAPVRRRKEAEGDRDSGVKVQVDD